MSLLLDTAFGDLDDCRGCRGGLGATATAPTHVARVDNLPVYYGNAGDYVLVRKGTNLRVLGAPLGNGRVPVQVIGGQFYEPFNDDAGNMVVAAAPTGALQVASNQIEAISSGGGSGFALLALLGLAAASTRRR